MHETGQWSLEGLPSHQQLAVNSCIYTAFSTVQLLTLPCNFHTMEKNCPPFWITLWLSSVLVLAHMPLHHHPPGVIPQSSLYVVKIKTKLMAGISCCTETTKTLPSKTSFGEVPEGRLCTVSCLTVLIKRLTQSKQRADGEFNRTAHFLWTPIILSAGTVDLPAWTYLKYNTVSVLVAENSVLWVSFIDALQPFSHITVLNPQCHIH